MPLSKLPTTGRVPKRDRDLSGLIGGAVRLPEVRGAAPETCDWQRGSSSLGKAPRVKRAPNAFLHFRQGSSPRVTSSAHLNFPCWQKHVYTSPVRLMMARQICLLASLDRKKKRRTIAQNPGLCGE